MVESQPSKLLVAGSIPVSRSRVEGLCGRKPATEIPRFLPGVGSGVTMGFEQAAIKIEKQQEYEKLQTAVEQAFSPGKIERLLEQLERKRIRIREFDAVLSERVLEQVLSGSIAGAGSEFGAWQLYQALPISDRAQMREFYLSKLETVDGVLRHKFKKQFQYY